MNGGWGGGGENGGSVAGGVHGAKEVLMRLGSSLAGERKAN
jgi:hypothetical protein